MEYLLKTLSTHSAIIFQIQSSCILALLTIGLIVRKKPNIHTKFMLSAIIWDIILILQIELSRSAIAKAMKAPVNPMILNIHVTLAVLTVLFYFYQAYTGKKLLERTQVRTFRPKHSFLGPIVYICRILTFITSFYANQDY